MTCILSVFVLRDVTAGELLTHTCFCSSGCCSGGAVDAYMFVFVLRDVAAGGLLTHACSFM